MKIKTSQDLVIINQQIIQIDDEIAYIRHQLKYDANLQHTDHQRLSKQSSILHDKLEEYYAKLGKK
jgi:hypothetical protein